MKTIVEEIIAGRKLTIETGRMARQAHGAVYVQYGGSAVLVAACSEPASRDMGFFPLTIEYRERTYAAGKIPGGFFKREGRPSEKEILTARLIDRPLRPLFPEGFKDETQVYCLVLSSDGENDPNLLGMVGGSAALMISDIPWDGPVSAIRAGRVNGEIILNPTVAQMEESDLELVVAVQGKDVVMLEGHCSELSEEVIADAIAMAAEEAAKINDLQIKLQQIVGREKKEFQAPVLPEGLYEIVYEILSEEMSKVYGKGNKENMAAAVNASKERAEAAVAEKFGLEEGTEEHSEYAAHTSAAIYRAEKEYVRSRLLTDGVRYDGRARTEVRNIECEVGVLPRTHGSALFTRGETQSLCASTLGGDRDEQRIDDLMGEYKKNFMLHYNFPSFSVGEVRPVRGPGRREIGHGHLAETAVKEIIPEEFPYTVRVVSDILESNGSSSQATICGASLCLMDAGVPVKSHVAGIALGLITDGERSIVLSDIAGVEDHLGDMDLKIAGTVKGVNAIQMDLKVEGVSQELLAGAFRQARENRLHIIEKMNACIDKPREELSQYAPRIITMQIEKDKIGKLIGPGGKNIRYVTEESGAEINIDDDGTVTILTNDGEKADKALHLIDQFVGVPKIGKIYEGTVVSIQTFGAFVEIMPGTDGLVHISNISNERISDVSSVLKRGQKVMVKVNKIRDDGKIDLIMKDIDQNGTAE
ncbi:polyribonucleotide nucleotidyltransferase [Candidatus Fermentibacteria bacterium]|nr:MAG: polyribonucleotide nucleotidyltransferase [Candidatus Fermentibacteria bacterium]